MKLIQVDGLGRKLGSKKKHIPTKKRPETARPGDGEASARLADAVVKAAGKRVYTRDFGHDDYVRGALFAWARTVPGWECGSALREGQTTGRPSNWVRLKGGKS